MSHGGERRRQTQQSKLGSFKISVKEKIPGEWDPQWIWAPRSRKAVIFTQLPATPSPSH